PYRNTISRWVASFPATGSTLKKKSPGLQRSSRTPANVEAVRQSVVQSPQQSARKHAAALRLSEDTARSILHLDLKFHPYKMTNVQELHLGDWENRVKSCQRILASVPLTTVLLTSDEAHFHLSGCVDKQNFRYWARTNPKELHERPLLSERVTVWCAAEEFGVLGPTLDEPKAEIREGIAVIPPDMPASVMNNFRKRLDVCIRSQGRHMDDTEFHK
ncbi:hypothetical protein B7P43_G03401, partial [Cryptotermes secundus]